MSSAEWTELPARAAAAQAAWRDAGLERRLHVLQQAGIRLASQRRSLDEGLYADGLSQYLAAYYGDWIVHQGSPELLAAYARDHVQWIDTRRGGELLVRRPDGVVLLVTPGNSPTINAAPLFSLLLPGNAVIVRAPPNDGGLRFIAERVLRDTLLENGFSSDLVQVVTGKTREVLEAVMPAPALRTVVFFGNSEAGQAVAEQGHRLGKKVVLELDGSDHMVVWRDADISASVRSACRAFDFSTQPCPIPKHFLVHEAAFDGFVAALRQALPRYSVTVQADAANGVLVPVARPERYFAALAELREVAEVLEGGYGMDATGRPDDSAPYVAPTLVAIEDEVCLSRPLRCFREEIFFPLLPIVRFRGSDEQIAHKMTVVLADSPFGLRASLWTQSDDVVAHFVRSVGDVGLLIVNDDHAQCPQYASPWGGPKRSGGPHGESHLFWQKTSHLQAIVCGDATPARRTALLESLGCARLINRPSGGAALLGEPPPSEASSSSTVLLDLHAGWAHLRLNRPARHNAVSAEMLAALAAAVERLDAQRAGLRCVVVGGVGPSFCSGADLKELNAMDALAARRFMLDATWIFRRLVGLPCPVIAAVQGHCLGGGFELALHCDLILAAQSATFGFPEAAHGWTTTAGSVARVLERAGARGRELLLMAQPITAEEALAMGLVSQVAADALLEQRLHAWVQRLCQLPAEGVAATKALMRQERHGPESAAWIAEAEAFERLLLERRSRP